MPADLNLAEIPPSPTGGTGTGTITARITLGGGATDWTATEISAPGNFIASFYAR